MVSTFLKLSELVGDISADMPIQHGGAIPGFDNDQRRRGSTPILNIPPNLQLNFEIYIDANTSEEKIEAIFKNMKKYLIDNE